MVLNPYPNDLSLFKWQLLISCIRIGRHGQRIVVKEGHKNPEGLLGFGLVIIRGGASIPIPVSILKTSNAKSNCKKKKTDYKTAVDETINQVPGKE